MPPWAANFIPAAYFRVSLKENEAAAAGNAVNRPIESAEIANSAM